MTFFDILKAEYTLVYSELFRRRSALIAMVAYPYLFAGFTLFFGYSMGSPDAFLERLKVDPIVYLITASYMLMALIVTVDDLFWRPLSDLMIGTLPYIIASPVNKLLLYFIIPLPRATCLLLMGFTCLIPVYLLNYGVEGIFISMLIIGLVALGCILMTPLAVIIASTVHNISESWRALDVIRPFIMILLGVYYPRLYMPLIGYFLSYLIPPSHVVEAVQILLSGVSSGVYNLVVLAITVTLLYVPVSQYSLRKWELRRVREGVKTS
ncbi:MAG: ABC transporter permease [Desulfurococcaceae archaeon]